MKQTCIPRPEAIPNQGLQALIIQQICWCSFSAVPNPSFAKKAHMLQLFSDLQDLLTLAPLDIPTFAPLDSTSLKVFGAAALVLRNVSIFFGFRKCLLEFRENQLFSAQKITAVCRNCGKFQRITGGR